MEAIHIFKNKDLVLNVNDFYDPNILNLDEWENFLDRLCGNRNYQKEAIKKLVIFFASGKYSSIEDLIKENYTKNIEIQSKYNSLEEYYERLQISGKLFANVDIATGTGKSYVIYGVAQIMLGLGLVDKVLVLCPSKTIESGLKEKFYSLSGDSKIKNSLPNTAQFKNPRIIDANVTIKEGDICVENIHAVYERTGSSINESLKNKGERTLILNDESHHIYNDNTKDRDLKKWKNFLLNSTYDFKYIAGFTGTAYIDDNYFNDVIYRYSLRDAIEDGIVKKIEYVQKDDNLGLDEKFQKIYQNHLKNIENYSLIKPISILITKDINNARILRENLVEFLVKFENIPHSTAEDKVLIVTSHNDHKSNIIKLKTVDQKDNPAEWIVSVSMLTEGWDVKNVFQIVPWEDKAFNSKLLIAQVLGRGLRIPKEYELPQPQVTVYNHDSWSKNIRGLVDEVLEIETKVCSETLKFGQRSKYNFSVYNLNYEKIPKQIAHSPKSEKNFSEMYKEGISLESQVINARKTVSYESIKGNYRDQDYIIHNETYSVDSIVDRIYEELETRFFEGNILKIEVAQYSTSNLPTREMIRDLIVRSMQKRGIKEEDGLVENNRIKVLQAFGTLLRKASKTVINEIKDNDLFTLDTSDLQNENTGIGNLRNKSALFLGTNWVNELNEISAKIVERMKEENINSMRQEYALNEINEYLFKTPMNCVIATGMPEFKFIQKMCEKEISDEISSWIKSRDKGFYQIEYTWRKNSHQQSNLNFNPDFFIKVDKAGTTYYLVIEIKDDKDFSDENKAKYKYAREHFKKLNKRLEMDKIKEKYIFHFLSPNGYSIFFEYLKNGLLLEDQDKFKCELEIALDEK